MPRQNKVVMGYGVRFSNESAEQAFRIYTACRGLFLTQKEAKAEVVRYCKDGNVGKNETVHVFKVVVEIIS